MSYKIFKHKSTGKLYFLIHEHVRVHTVMGINSEENTPYFEWIGDKILYKSKDPTIRDPYFVQDRAVFFQEFEPVDE